MKSLFKTLLLSIMCLAFFSCDKEHINPLSDLADENIHSLNMHFYPSTIRMINLANDSSFYRATKDIKRLQFMSVNLNDSASIATYDQWLANQNYDEWDELLSATIGDNKAVIFAPKNSDEYYFARVRYDGGAYLVWAEGKVNLNQVMKVANEGIDLGPVSSFMGNKDKEEKRRESWKRAKEEQERILQQDSVLTEDQIN